MGPAVLLHLLRGVRRRDGRVGRRGDRADGDIRRVRRGQLVHRVGRAPVPRDAHRHQLFPAQPHRGRPAVRGHHARPGLRPRRARLAVRRLRVPRAALLAGNARRELNKTIGGRGVTSIYRQRDKKSKSSSVFFFVFLFFQRDRLHRFVFD